MTKHRSINEYRAALEEYIFPSLVAEYLGVTRQAVYYRLATNKELYDYWRELLKEWTNEQFMRKNRR